MVVNGAREALTAREFALLQALLERPGAILSREQLEDRIYGWGEEVDEQRDRRADPRHAPQARRGRDPQRARPGLARSCMTGVTARGWPLVRGRVRCARNCCCG